MDKPALKLTARIYDAIQALRKHGALHRTASLAYYEPDPPSSPPLYIRSATIDRLIFSDMAYLDRDTARLTPAGLSLLADIRDARRTPDALSKHARAVVDAKRRVDAEEDRLVELENTPEKRARRVAYYQGLVGAGNVVTAGAVYRALEARKLARREAKRGHVVIPQAVLQPAHKPRDKIGAGRLAQLESIRDKPIHLSDDRIPRPSIDMFMKWGYVAQPIPGGPISVTAAGETAIRRAVAAQAEKTFKRRSIETKKRRGDL